MSTSGSYDSTSTMTNIIYDAFALINAHDPGETLPSEKWAHSKRVLNQLINFMSVREGLWLRTEVSHTLTPGTASYTVGDGETIDTPKPMRILDARRTVSSVDIPMDIIGRDEYVSIPNKTLQTGPLMLYYDQQRDTGTLYVWPTGSSSDKTITFTSSRPIQDFDDEGNNPDLPKEWILLLTYMLAEKLAPTYLAGVVPPGVASGKLEMMASILSYDQEITSVKFQPV